MHLLPRTNGLISDQRKGLRETTAVLNWSDGPPRHVWSIPRENFQSLLPSVGSHQFGDLNLSIFGERDREERDNSYFLILANPNPSILFLGKQISKYSRCSLFVVIRFYEDRCSEYWAITLRGNTKLGSYKPLVTTSPSTEPCINVFYQDTSLNVYCWFISIELSANRALNTHARMKLI